MSYQNLPRQHPIYLATLKCEKLVGISTNQR